MGKYYIYAFLDKSKPGKYKYFDLLFDYEPFYIGKGRGDRMKLSLYRGSVFKINKINKIINSGGEVISVKIFENLENEESLVKEIEVISKIGRRDIKKGPLVNQTNGGDGRLFSPHSDETKRKISNTKKSQNISIKHTDETKSLLSEVNKGKNNPFYGKKHTDEVKESQSKRVSGKNHPMYGKKHTEESLIKIKKNRKVDKEKLIEISIKNNSKKVLQFDLNGNFINEYSSIKIASIETGLSESLIGKTCRGVVKNPRKFIFKFKDNESFILNNSFKIKYGDIISIDNNLYTLLKRNKKSFLVKDSLGNEYSFRKKDYEFIFDKNIII